MDVAVSVSPQKSTNGRSAFFPASIRWLRRGFQLVDRVAPELGAELLRRAFFHPPAIKLRAEERRILDAGSRLSFQVDGERVAGWIWGIGPTVLLIHGWGGRAGQMTALVRPLLERGFRVVALDLPGHGRSSGRHSSVVHFARTLVRADRELGRLYGVVAHSLGAAAVTLARTMGLRVPRAVFFAPPLDFEPFWRRFRDAFELSAAQWQGLLARGEQWLGLPFEQVEPRAQEALFGGPLLVVHDKGDREVPVSSGEELADLWPSARIVLTAGLGHVRILRDPETLERAAAFLADGQRDFFDRTVDPSSAIS